MHTHPHSPHPPVAPASPNPLARELDADIPWKSYVDAQFITAADYQTILAYDHQSWETKASVLASPLTGARTVTALVNVLRTISRIETVHYTLALLLDAISADPTTNRPHLALLHAVAPTCDLFDVLLRLLSRPEPVPRTQALAALILAKLVDARPDRHRPLLGPGAIDLLSGEGRVLDGVATTTSHARPGKSTGIGMIGRVVVDDSPVLGVLVGWITAQLRHARTNPEVIATAVQCLNLILKEQYVRAACVQKDVVASLTPFIASTKKTEQTRRAVQVQYDVAMCFWQLAFHADAAHDMLRIGTVGHLVELLRSARKLKVARAALLALKTLAAGHHPHAPHHGPHHDSSTYDTTTSSSTTTSTTSTSATAKASMMEAMVEAGLKRVVATKLQETYDDPDVVAALEFLQEAMNKRGLEMSQFDKYRREVMDRELTRSPMHVDKAFWTQNVHLFEERDWGVLRALLKLLDLSTSSVTLAVGCQDLANFIQYHPRGRQLAHELGAKEIIMRRLEHADAEVQRGALLAFQHLLLPSFGSGAGVGQTV